MANPGGNSVKTIRSGSRFGVTAYKGTSAGTSPRVRSKAAEVNRLDPSAVDSIIEHSKEDSRSGDMVFLSCLFCLPVRAGMRCVLDVYGQNPSEH